MNALWASSRVIFILCIIVLAVASAAFGEPTVSTDKENYSPGEVVVITGTGWLPGEAVSLSFYADSTEIPHTILDTIVDENGNIYSREFTIGQDEVDMAFLLKAEGQTSGLSAETIFLDGYYVRWVSVSYQSPSPVQAGGSATYYVTVEGRRWWLGCLGRWTDLFIETALPPGVSYSFNPPEVRPTGSLCFAVSTLTLTTSPSTPAGSFEFGVKAYYSSTDYARSDGVLNVTLPEDTTPPVPDVDPLPVISGECRASIPGAPTATDDRDGTVIGVTSDPLTYAHEGYYSVHWTYTDAAGNSSHQYQRVDVYDVTPPIVNCPSDIVRNAESGKCSARVSYYFHASDNCGPVTCTAEPPSWSEFPVGNTVVTVTATDVAHHTSSCHFNVTVNDVTPPVISCPQEIVKVTDPGKCTAKVTFAPQATDNCPRATVTTEPQSGFDFPIGTTEVTCTARDASGNTASCQFNVSVYNPVPVVTIAGPPSGAIYAAGTPVSLSGSFTDNTGDAHTAKWTCDGIELDGTVDESGGTVSGSYAFDSAGVYFIELAVTDQCDGTGTATTVDDLAAMIVIYDPGAGFVTGGGWINSLAGAYSADPTLTGKANFGFVSKYLRGASTPSGQTEFMFKVADLNFHSTSYDWLVIGNFKAMYKGSGTINDAGDYGFMLSAIDGDMDGGGDVDKFRIKIVDKALDEVVYDNQMGAPEGDDPVTTLGGGSIVIHKSKGSEQSVASQPETDPINKEEPLPTEHRLLQNFPNPFNPTTRISYDLPVPSHVKLAVYHVSGRQVKVLVDTWMPSGRHSVLWDVRNSGGQPVASGIYLYCIQAGDFRATKKMILLR